MAPTRVLVTGANRGLGLGMVERFLVLPGHTVVAAVRDPEHPTAKALNDLPKGSDSDLIIVKYDAGVWQSAADVVKQLADKEITSLDIVVANAGIAKQYPLAKDVKGEDILEHVQVNVLSTISLYQATRDLLQKSTGKPTYCIVGSGAGSLGKQPPVPSAVYGPSKAMINWYGARINAEDEWLNTFILDPGWVQTDMGNSAAQGWGIEAAPVTVEDSCSGAVKLLSTATKEEHGGRVVLYTGEVQPW